ncbi:MAG: hypothetical protein K0S25_1902 [Bacillus sp. (in: firmicutes)]|jgi:hypothetical protein|uniref:DUF2768 domain-containing protein n=1 Tax=Bacillus sp. 1NLA3E TaxID=666686 RepID=UPI000247E317|nr:DUF2768 domain-containing protein [Bacillus sp. 1NLA3E]AGK54714.1 hypothetical protein B1NLA3E_14840 [Bacillus sp. 1NLA3E]MDF2904264.1 hypothetical protein [Bacillus sp. (in: firmicutes)]
MSPSLVKMWISLAGMGFMFLSLIFIYFSRFKLKGIFRIFTAIIAYALMIMAGLLILFVVLSGPTID